VKYPAYPEQRAVHDTHFRQLPAHWAVKRVKFVATVGNGSTPSRDDSAYWQEGTFPWLNSSVVNQEVVTQADQFVTAMALRECYLPRVVPPAVLVGITGEGRTRGMAATLAIEATINQHLVFVKPVGDRVDVRFLRRVFDASYDHLRSDSEGAGSTKGAITCEQIKEMALPVPPSDEQREIAAFLDWRTTQIDALIAKKQALLERLSALRLNVITSAITKGIEANPPMRDSGIAWVGAVPTHWQVPPLKMRYAIELGKMLDEKRITGANLLPYLRNVDVQWQAINWDDLPQMDIDAHELERYTVAPGDVLVCEGGEVGRAAVVEEVPGAIGFQKALHRLRAHQEDELPKFIYYTLIWAASTKVFDVEGTSTIAHLTADQLRRYRFPQPPLNEQREICDFLDARCGKIDRQKTKVNEAIERLTEYRSALITAAVTGQIDVRGVPVPAPV
jgi:type I restriction enzyme, S subunit